MNEFHQYSSVICRFSERQEHFYNDCFAGDAGVSTHYVVLGHCWNVAADFALPVADEQHRALRWWPIAQALAAPDVHQLSKDYLFELT